MPTDSLQFSETSAEALSKRILASYYAKFRDSRDTESGVFPTLTIRRNKSATFIDPETYPILCGSIEERLKTIIKPHQYKTLRKLRSVLNHIETTIPVERILFLTLTFTPGTTDTQASKEFSAINRQLTRLFPGSYLRVLAFTKQGAPHLHVLLIADCDVQTGFNNEVFAELQEMNKQPTPLNRRRWQLWKSLSTNKNLRRFRREVREIVEARRRKSKSRYTFGPVLDLLPIRTNMKAVAKYLEKNFKQSAGRAEVTSKREWQPGRVTKGTKLVAYGKALPKPLPNPVTRGYIRFLEKIDVFVRALKMPRVYFMNRFGRDFYYVYMTQFLPRIEEDFGSDMRKWDVEEMGKQMLHFFRFSDQWTSHGWPLEALRYAGWPPGARLRGTPAVVVPLLPPPPSPTSGDQLQSFEVADESGYDDDVFDGSMALPDLPDDN
jgi:hypothetical protein